MPILRDCAIWYGGYDLTSAANEVSIDSSFTTVPVTTFVNIESILKTRWFAFGDDGASDDVRR